MPADQYYHNSMAQTKQTEKKPEEAMPQDVPEMIEQLFSKEEFQLLVRLSKYPYPLSYSPANHSIKQISEIACGYDLETAAIEMLHEAAKPYLVGFLGSVEKNAIHAGRDADTMTAVCD